MVAFEEWGNRSTRRKPLGAEKRREENQQTQPTYDAGSGNRTRTTLVGGECSHHCAIPAPHKQGHCQPWTYPLKKWSSHLQDNVDDSLVCAPEKLQVSSTGFESMTIHLSTTRHKISFTQHSFHGNTWAKQIDLLASEWLHDSDGESSAPASYRSWDRISWKRAEILQVHIWDSRRDCPASVRIISSIHLWASLLKRFFHWTYLRQILPLEICLAMIQYHRNTYLCCFLWLQLTVLRIPWKHATGRISEKQKDRSQLGHSSCCGRGFDRCHTVLGKQRHRAQQHNNVYCADSRRI